MCRDAIVMEVLHESQPNMDRLQSASSFENSCEEEDDSGIPCTSKIEFPFLVMCWIDHDKILQI